MNSSKQEYLLESRLKKLDPELHQRFRDTVFAMQNTLFRFRQLFPEFTDHSSLHSVSVIQFCNQIIGPQQIQQLSADEIYMLLVGCYLHDVGMGISRDQYEVFRRQIPFGDYLEKHPDSPIDHIIRDFHQEFSAAFIRKYSDFLEIPSPEHGWGIIQICRGHRKTDLLDPAEYPSEFTMPNGSTVHLPYLSALIRLADEIDVLASRNPLMLYDMESFIDPKEIAYHKRHLAVQSMNITRDAFELLVAPADPETTRMITDMKKKMEQTLQYCRKVAEATSPFRISQKEVTLTHLQQ